MQPDDEDDVPDDLACPITFSLMSDPVVRDYADTYTVPQPCLSYVRGTRAGRLRPVRT